MPLNEQEVKKMALVLTLKCPSKQEAYANKDESEASPGEHMDRHLNMDVQLFSSESQWRQTHKLNTGGLNEQIFPSWSASH